MARLNMMNEARAGSAPQRGTKETGREIDFVKLRQGWPGGSPGARNWIDGLVAELLSRRSAR